MDKKRVVITGIGPLGSPGIGKENFWQGILQKKTNVRLEKYFLDKEPWAEFYLHDLDNFDISNSASTKKS